LSGAKNAYGAVNFYVVVLGGYAIHKGLSSKDRLFALAGVVSIMAGAAGLVLSRASGSMVGAILGLLTYFILLRITRFRPTSRAGLLIVIFFFGSLAAFFLSFFWNELYSGFLRYLGKDPGLTGRVDLWDIADNIISRNFEVGVGQFAFWVQNDPLPEAIWSEMGILSRGGFNFHNSFREVLVHLGLLGLVVYASVIGYLGLKQLKTALFQPRAEKLFYVVIILGAIERMPVESFLPIAPVGLSTILFVSALILRPEKNTRPNGIPPRQVRDTVG
jgi:exopolysaccharide production protein ExoQ